MRRRRFVGSIGAGLAAAGVPAFITRAFAQERPEQGDAAADVVREARRRAREAGRPLLVVVIPENDGDKWERGYAWGELLNHGGDEQLAPLAMVEIVAAARADLREIAPSIARSSSDPVAVLVETDGRGHARALDPALPDTSYRAVPEGLDWEARERWIDARVTERIAVLSDAIADAVAPNLPVLRARAAQQEAGMPASERRQILSALAGERRLTSDHIASGPAIVALSAAGADEARANELRARLAAAFRERVGAGPPAGARWARSGGCGVSIENPTTDEEAMMGAVGCGMGYVPERSRRFLYFFTGARY